MFQTRSGHIYCTKEPKATAAIIEKAAMLLSVMIVDVLPSVLIKEEDFLFLEINIFNI